MTPEQIEADRKREILLLTAYANWHDERKDRDEYDDHESFEAGANWQAAQPQWISVSERLPDIADTSIILVATHDGNYVTVMSASFLAQQKQPLVTHWKPLPLPPATGE